MSEIKDENLKGNEKIEADIKTLLEAPSDEALAVLLTGIRARMKDNGHLVVAVDAAPGVGESLQVRTVSMNDMKWMVAYTSFDEELKGGESVMSAFTAPISQILAMITASDELAGVIINPYGGTIKLDKTLSSLILGENK